jgi:hypothetical protein
MPALGGLSPHAPYNYVFAIEIAFLLLALLLAVPGKGKTDPTDTDRKSVEVS